MTISEAVNNARRCLERHQVPDAGTDAMLLLHFVCGMDRAYYYAHSDEELPERDLQAYLEKVRIRAQRIPLQQIVGETYFCGLKFQVSPDVLTPRPDTELLVEEALKRVRPGEKVLDLCTGSGCVLISILKLGQKLTGTGTDLSERALQIARENAKINDLGETDAEFVLCDLYPRHGENAAPAGRSEDILYDGMRKEILSDGTGEEILPPKTGEWYDMIVSNPPYIRSGEIGHLMEEVRDHEPHMALDGGQDGLAFYRRILDGSAAHLRDGGWLLVEIGYDQGEEVRSMFDDHRYESVRVLKDLGGNDRVVLGRKAAGAAERDRRV